jgi:hypothetical protein
MLKLNLVFCHFSSLPLFDSSPESTVSLVSEESTVSLVCCPHHSVGYEEQ